MSLSSECPCPVTGVTGTLVTNHKAGESTIGNPYATYSPLTRSPQITLFNSLTHPVRILHNDTNAHITEPLGFLSAATGQTHLNPNQLPCFSGHSQSQQQHSRIILAAASEVSPDERHCLVNL